MQIGYCRILARFCHPATQPEQTGKTAVVFPCISTNELEPGDTAKHRFHERVTQHRDLYIGMLVQQVANDRHCHGYITQ